MLALHFTPLHFAVRQLGWFHLIPSLPTHLFPVLIGHIVLCLTNWRGRKIKELPVDFIYLSFRSIPFLYHFFPYHSRPIYCKWLYQKYKKLIKRIKCTKWDEVDHTKTAAAMKKKRRSKKKQEEQQQKQQHFHLFNQQNNNVNFSQYKPSQSVCIL